MSTTKELLARAIAKACNLDPDAISPKMAKNGHIIPEWMFFLPAATAVLTALLEPSDIMVDCASVAFEGEQLAGPLSNGRLPSENIFRAAIQAALDEVETGEG